MYMNFSTTICMRHQIYTKSSFRFNTNHNNNKLFYKTFYSTHFISLRPIHNGVGRGSLYYINSDAQRHRKKALGTLRGIRHSSQATLPESGQLYYKKLMLHVTGGATNSGSEQLTHLNCTWEYLIPSLLRCAKMTIDENIWEKLCKIEEIKKENKSNLPPQFTERECKLVEEGQKIFRYELHQRLPLLEDSVVDADLSQLINWFYCARRAWVRLPTIDCKSSLNEIPSNSNNNNTLTSLSNREKFLIPSPEILSHFFNNDNNNIKNDMIRDVTPGRHQIYDTSIRIAKLTDIVATRAQEEMSQLNNNNKPKSLRLLAKEEKLRQCLVNELKWHGISHNASLLLTK